MEEYIILYTNKVIINVYIGVNLGFQVRRPKNKKKELNRYSYNINKLSIKINTQNHFFLIY